MTNDIKDSTSSLPIKETVIQCGMVHIIGLVHHIKPILYDMVLKSRVYKENHV